MCAFERPTTSRVAHCSAMRTRVLRARRTRASFLFMVLPLLFLRFLDLDVFVGVADALALVGLRRTVSANLGGRLPDLLLVRTPDDDLRLLRRLDLHALRHHVHDR